MEDQRLTKKERRMLAKKRKIEVRAKRDRQNNLKRFGMWAGVITVLALITYGIFSLTSSSNQTSEVLSITTSETDQIKGNPEASIVLIEYSDFQCPACKNYSNYTTQLAEEFGDDILVAFRHFPLKTIHKNAEDAAKASEAAGKQNKFWEMHDMLFEKQSEWEGLNNAKDEFEKYALSLELNIDQYKTDYESDEIRDKINSDYQSGLKNKVNSTPTFFLNGKEIKVPNNYEEFKKLVTESINK